MIGFLLSLAFLGLTWVILRGGFAGSGPGLRRTGLDPNAVGLSAVAVLTAVWFFGLISGIAIVLALLLHEYGHVAAWRICGHRDARFRLIPILGGQAISARPASSHAEEIFITLMGPAIGLAPMLALMTGSDLIWPLSPLVAELAASVGLMIAILSAFNLMPFYPLDGGRILRVLSHSLLPAGAAQVLTLAFSAVAGALAVISDSWVLFIFVLIGLTGLLTDGGALIAVQRPMRRGVALVALAAWITTTAAFARVALPALGLWG